MLQLEALQANDGDCLLLHYDTGGNPRVILIDGGSSGIYRNVIEKRLDQLRGNSAVLNLRLVVVSHIDADHITGIVDSVCTGAEVIGAGRAECGREHARSADPAR